MGHPIDMEVILQQPQGFAMEQWNSFRHNWSHIRFDTEDPLPSWHSCLLPSSSVSRISLPAYIYVFLVKFGKWSTPII